MLITCHFHSSLYAEIIIHPQDITILPNQTATFKCVANGSDTATFTLNGTRYADLPQRTKNDFNVTMELNGTLIERTLNIKNASKYNETTVQCKAYKFEGVLVESKNATLTIQGINCLHTIRRVHILAVNNLYCPYIGSYNLQKGRI